MVADRDLDVIVFGTINMDLVAVMERFPVVGETLASKDYFQMAGGKGANQAVAASRLGAKTAFVGKVGQDSFGDTLREGLAKNQIDTKTLYSSETNYTGNAIITVSETGENMIITNLGANQELTLEEVEASLPLAENSRVALLQLEMKKHVAEAIINSLEPLNLYTILNYAPVIPLNQETVKQVDLLVVNEVEASQILSECIHSVTEAHEAAKKLVNKGFHAVCITLGSQGVVYVSQSESFHVPAKVVDTVDTTAAGDCFCGALARYFSEGMNIKRCIERAVKASSLSIQRRGAQESLPYEREILEVY